MTEKIVFISKAYKTSQNKLFIYIPKAVSSLVDLKKKYKVILEPIEG